jgi:hypothetical protein
MAGTLTRLIVRATRRSELARPRKVWAAAWAALQRLAG